MNYRENSNSELIRHPDGRIYHLNLLPSEIAPVILLVGDPSRVKQVSNHFDEITVKQSNREFYTHTGFYNNQPVSVISTGIGPDNIDIAINELDALQTCMPGSDQAPKGPLKLIRLGTCGALQPYLSPGSAAISDFAIGLDNVASFYEIPYTDEERSAYDALTHYCQLKAINLQFYVKKAPGNLTQLLKPLGNVGFTVTCPGFYGPQGRSIRIKAAESGFVDKFQDFSFKQLAIENLEMETSALFALSHAMGHEAVTIALALANRYTGEYLGNHNADMNYLASMVLDTVTQSR